MKIQIIVKVQYILTSWLTNRIWGQLFNLSEIFLSNVLDVDSVHNLNKKIKTKLLQRSWRVISIKGWKMILQFHLILKYIITKFSVAIIYKWPFFKFCVYIYYILFICKKIRIYKIFLNIFHTKTVHSFFIISPIVTQQLLITL